ncbi:MAG: phosphatidylserine decarboxylase [Elusimicrobia bacterium]|nr:phosphatidylserine decarboxylase [Elusimicrobiota bacterium]MDE2425258.1 phosphatidylserine decarboxylase [Elusimicrobiota bacterium]
MLYIDRATGRLEVEQVYGEAALRLLYGPGPASWLLPAVSRLPWLSWACGRWQDTRWSARRIRPFIERFGLDASEFLKPVEDFRSFNEFFYRKLKPEARPITPGDEAAVMPADARCLFFPNLGLADGFFVKGRRFDLAALLDDAALARRYADGGMVLARLCPVDYHRFHFPCGGVPGPARLINGWLYSVNPIALARNVDILVQNKRSVCELDSPRFGRLLLIEIGATNVGGIRQTYVPGRPCAKGEEKGYFAFGASALILLFERGRIRFDSDLLEASRGGREILCRMGQSLGRAPASG